MSHLQPIHTFEHIKLLADPRRLAILRRLMAAPASLTQLGAAFGEHPAWIRHHLKQLEAATLVELAETRVSGGIVEKFYRASAEVYALSETILPDEPGCHYVVLQGSHDLALDILARRLEENAPHVRLLSLPVGSLDGLTALRQGASHISGCHLFDAASGDYNRPYVRHFFADRQMALVTLAYRQQGWIVASGNPRQFCGAADLARPDMTLIHRKRSSGTRLWLDDQLRRMGIPAAQVRACPQDAATHLEVAEAIREGRADVGLGIQAAAARFGLDFIPVFHERYDLVVSPERLAEPALQPFFETLVSGEFRRAVEGLGGYETAHTGDQIIL